LIKLAEEASEIAQAATKSLVFGLDSTNPYTKIKNKEQICSEFYDLVALIYALQTDEFIPEWDEEIIDKHIADKFKKHDEYK